VEQEEQELQVLSQVHRFITEEEEGGEDIKVQTEQEEMEEGVREEGIQLLVPLEQRIQVVVEEVVGIIATAVQVDRALLL